MDFNARQYDPQIGRFLGVDPLADFGGQDRYSPYAAMGNMPESMVDPDGLEPRGAKPPDQQNVLIPMSPWGDGNSGVGGGGALSGNFSNPLTGDISGGISWGSLGANGGISYQVRQERLAIWNGMIGRALINAAYHNTQVWHESYVSADQNPSFDQKEINVGNGKTKYSVNIKARPYDKSSGISITLLFNKEVEK